MAKPILYDLYCGVGGWSRAFLDQGYNAIGFDIERHEYGEKRYPGQLVLQDVRTLHGSQLRNAAVIVGSSPCQEFSYRAMPWKRAKALPPPELGMELFNAQFRIQREASEAAGRYIPLVVENVCGAQRWVGKAKAHFGSYYLWGDVESVGGRIVARSGAAPVFGAALRPRSQPKVAGLNWSNYALTGEVSPHWRLQKLKTVGHVNIRDGYSHTRHLTNQRESDAARGVKQSGLSGEAWFNAGAAAVSSSSASRKAASALIAEIPYDLAVYIARAFRPSNPTVSRLLSSAHARAGRLSLVQNNEIHDVAEACLKL